MIVLLSFLRIGATRKPTHPWERIAYKSTSLSELRIDQKNSRVSDATHVLL